MKTNAALAGLQQKNCMAVSRLIELVFFVFFVQVEMFLWGLLILNSVMNVCEDVYEQ